MSKTLHLPISAKWFDLILSGEKKEEYREIKWHYCPRFFNLKVNRKYFSVDAVIQFVKTGNDLFVHFDTVTLTNGYRKDSPRMIVEFKDITIGYGNPDWGAPNEHVFIIRLGKILETSNLKTKDMKEEKINYQKEVQKVYPKAYEQWAMGHCLITDGKGNSISDLIRGTDNTAKKISWENAYNKILNLKTKL